MRLASLSLLGSLLGLSCWVAGCDDPAPVTPPGPPVTITITSNQAPALVAFRDGIEGAWQTAAMKLPTTFEAEVHGPYVVAVVCEDLAAGTVTTRQVGRSLDDDREVALPCTFPADPPGRALTGHMVQAGRVQIAGATRTSTVADWDFSLSVPDGTFDLLARTTDRIAVRHATVIAGNTALATPIDLLQEGAPFVDVAFTVTNAAPTETLVASVHLSKPIPLSPLNVYLGPPTPAKVAPDSVLIPTDAQTVSLQATAGTETRSLRRPFRVGGNTAYTVPASLGARWESASRSMGVSWSFLPAFDVLDVNARGTSADMTKSLSHDLDLSPRFVAATGLMEATIDTDIPGYKPEWRIDFARGHSRQLFVQGTVNGEISTNIVSETL